jgi:hypothetical protein
MREAAVYLENNDMTPDERQNLLAWINSGERVLDNPWYMADENGNPMDYLTALRMANDLRAQNLG